MAKRDSAPAKTHPDPLPEAIDRLTGELRVLRDVLDEIREDFAWAAQNCAAGQRVDHVHVRQMGLDPGGDWGGELQLSVSELSPRGVASPLESDTLDRIVEELQTTFEAVAQRQLDIVLTALDGVREEIIRTLRHRRSDPTGESAGRPADLQTEPTQQKLQTPAAPTTPRTLGRLF